MVIVFQPESPGDTQMEHFRKAINTKYNLNLETYWDLHAWSCEETEAFWSFLWDYVGIISHKKWDQILEYKVPMYPRPHWFQGSILNFAENIIEGFLKTRSLEDTVIIQTNETDNIQNITMRELKDTVRQLASVFRSRGIVQGDIVAVYGSNHWKVIAWMLAATSLGAIFTASSTDFGPWAVYSRFHQLKKLKCILTTTDYNYNGKLFDHRTKLKELLPMFEKEFTSLDIVVMNEHSVIQKDQFNSKYLVFGWDDYLSLSSHSELTYFGFPFDTPLYIVNSSGTTGEPKCIVHSLGGTLLQHIKEHLLHQDGKPGDILLQITTTAWMMWHWMVSSISLGVTLVLYDGSPMYPTPLHLWHLIEKLNVTHFGTSAKYLSILESQRISLIDLQLDLRVVMSTGSPLSPSCYDYFYIDNKKAFKNVALYSITGGTDLLSLFLGGVPSLPVHRGELVAPCLGMKVEVFNEIVQMLKDHTQTLDAEGSTSIIGELVCTKVFPAQPIFFLQDKVNDSNSFYYKAYFETYGPTIWHHGDYISKNNQSRGYTVLGRSDGILNPSGVRFGSSELYQVIQSDSVTSSSISDTLAIGYSLPGNTDEQVILFVQLQDNCKFSSCLNSSNCKNSSQKTILTSERCLPNMLKERLVSIIRQELSPRHVPHFFFAVPRIPYTMNGKKAEVIVKKLFQLCSKAISSDTYQLAEQKNIETRPVNADIQAKLAVLSKGLENPECLQVFMDIYFSHFSAGNTDSRHI